MYFWQIKLKGCIDIYKCVKGLKYRSVSYVYLFIIANKRMKMNNM